MRTDLIRRLDDLMVQLPKPVRELSLRGLFDRRYMYLRARAGCEVAANTVNGEMRWHMIMGSYDGLTAPVSILAAHGVGALLCGPALWDRLMAEVATVTISPAEALELAQQLGYEYVSDWLGHCLGKRDCREYFSCRRSCAWPRENGW